jgi:hypothetical protein
MPKLLEYNSPYALPVSKSPKQESFILKFDHYTMRKGIKVPAELSYGNRLKYDMVAKVFFNKEVESLDTNRFYAFIIIPDFGLYAFTDN